MNRFVLLCTAAITTLSASPGLAKSLFFDFEDAVPAGSPASPNSVIVPQADGWTGGPNGIELHYGGLAGAPAATGGKVFVELDTSANSYMQHALTAGVYTLGFLYSPRPSVPAFSNGISISIIDDKTNAIVQDSIFDVARAGGLSTSWQKYLIDFSVGSGQSVRFSATGTSNGLGGYVDNIAMTNVSPVPEPATWGLMSIGLAVAGCVARRRRNIGASLSPELA